jgi:hypothetical protein
MKIRNQIYPISSIFLFGMAIFSGASCFNTNPTESEQNITNEQSVPNEQNVPSEQNIPSEQNVSNEQSVSSEQSVPSEQNISSDQSVPIGQEQTQKEKEKSEPQQETITTQITALVQQEMQQHETKETECSICHESKRLQSIRCGHYTCVKCITEWLVNKYEESNNVGTRRYKDGDPIISCPECRADLSYLVPST